MSRIESQKPDEDMGVMSRILLAVAVVGALIVLVGMNLNPEAPAPTQIAAHAE